MASAHASGSASSFADVLAALHSFLTANGWASAAATSVGTVYSQDGVVMRLWATSDAIHLIGAASASGGTTSDEAFESVKIASLNPNPVVFPVSYEFSLNDEPHEVYIVVSYGGNKYQHLHFGKSDIPGIGGTGAWFGGSMRASNADPRIYMDLNINSANTSISGQALGFFIDGHNAASFIHTGDLEGVGWSAMLGLSYTPGSLMGQSHLAGLLMALPSRFNESEVLLPIYARMYRTDGTATIVASLRHARMMRIDNVTPGDIITYGTDQWKAIPLHAKSVVERNGITWNIGAEHSGTWGVAIRYYGG